MGWGGVLEQLRGRLGSCPYLHLVHHAQDKAPFQNSPCPIDVAIASRYSRSSSATTAPPILMSPGSTTARKSPAPSPFRIPPLLTISGALLPPPCRLPSSFASSRETAATCASSSPSVPPTSPPTPVSFSLPDPSIWIGQFSIFSRKICDFWGQFWLSLQERCRFQEGRQRNVTPTTGRRRWGRPKKRSVSIPPSSPSSQISNPSCLRYKQSTSIWIESTPFPSKSPNLRPTFPASAASRPYNRNLTW